ncbi:MAG: hypothetical protein A2504_01265 [Bdellovibrionales bacterium RIFOXYD12_FULL_39_22]|nr:MAG: hypothetical protein A2385_02155 [Bdellovibrionales bacterium RIFOXYB1_FULL_39_21]OFZ42737.1 MAG: hypothetical protein A2485_10340 [Bdellovibrionales bacterium RIFOXYC12_FULL_39_17]OFZ47296.1 MAG: hypothetical protein A2404_14945 [Bdellovibrionales bacterium RIFOXYC1_FULL_39_130]OFZ71426.1 MAG: hypothetical protein A2451_10745 [Bdellovibrionales bacterium RIFOXYC2_FULL_39_8]OFZ75462.1 MAG: hypothetical protein A2560_04215 [Bdellovibrionales bacterium RIFOXYD1_FULL_39_84]OFZ93416.1 MAG:
MKISKILIANRGEIAIRVINTCREMGIKTVTIYTEDEIGLPHTFSGDFSICLGQGPLSQTYLNQELIVKIALEQKVDAIHPGYGFLSENPTFAKKVTEAGIIFIGPSPESMRIMGDKKTSKETVEKIGVPLIPGYHGNNQDPNFLKETADKIGYPVLIKASAGGGGKGMRVVNDPADFQSSLESAKREAKNSFGNDIVLLERYILNPRHIEVQMMSDKHGNHLHFFERECSIQRRHQKIIEETPSTALTAEIRRDITATATKITSYINYEGAGTMEFILDQSGKFYFLEMNTRLQVEHPITEMVTGYDLVRLQIEVAQGDILSVKQEDISQQGHAIEVRIYAEDPANNFLPSIGKVLKTGRPTLNNVRLDTGYIDGNEVTVNFDPMLAKLIVHAATRNQAIDKMGVSLDDVIFLGLKTNRAYLKRILSTKEFKDGLTYTNFVEVNKDKLLPKDLRREEIALAISSQLFCPQETYHTNVNYNATTRGSATTAWDTLGSFSANFVGRKIIINGEEVDYKLTKNSDGEVQLSVMNRNYNFRQVAALGDQLVINDGKKNFTVSMTKNRRTNKVHAVIQSKDVVMEIPTRTRKKSGEAEHGGMLSPMPGKIFKILVKEGEAVAKNQPLLIMEAMKMEHTIKANGDGKISKIHFKEGEVINGGVNLIELEK